MSVYKKDSLYLLVKLCVMVLACWHSMVEQSRDVNQSWWDSRQHKVRPGGCLGLSVFSLLKYKLPSTVHSPSADQLSEGII